MLTFQSHRVISNSSYGVGQTRHCWGRAGSLPGDMEHVQSWRDCGECHTPGGRLCRAGSVGIMPSSQLCMLGNWLLHGGQYLGMVMLSLVFRACFPARHCAVGRGRSRIRSSSLSGPYPMSMVRSLSDGSNISMGLAGKGENGNETRSLGLALGLLWQHGSMFKVQGSLIKPYKGHDRVHMKESEW